LNQEREGQNGLVRRAPAPRLRSGENGRSGGPGSPTSKHEPVILRADGPAGTGQELAANSEQARVSELALAGCSTADIALLAGCGKTKLHQVHRKTIAKARAERRKQILENQNAAAAKGNATILVWLGKVELDQADKKARPEPVDAYLDAMDAASAQHNRANPRSYESSKV
jgi:hypothetical protein